MKNKKSKSLTIVMPALDEEARIEKTVMEIYQAAKKILDEFEIIIVDDGSSDRTYLIVISLIEKLGCEVKVVRKERNEGIGSAFLSALNIASCEYITCIPSDLAFPIDGIEYMFSTVGDVPIILTYRKNLNTRPFLRRFFSYFVTLFACILTFKEIKDVQSMFVSPVYLIKSIKIKYSKYIFQMQLISFLLNRRVCYKQIPVSYSSDADSHSGMLRLPVLLDVLKSISELFILKITGKLK